MRKRSPTYRFSRITALACGKSRIAARFSGPSRHISARCRLNHGDGLSVVAWVGRGVGMARLVIVSNRVVVPSGNDSAGGLAVAVRAVLKRHPGIWFGWSGRVTTKPDATVRTIERGDQS